ncbi:2-methoxy-6-polyprenyl-1,4-benzoquinol methylase, mitochondrial [Echinococcus granulosus]|uniref:2-methoxy-6-polyprenyl-1,4-benzoquinol methylase, mitochondrial n=1 Tax=Echinococcus granulosus TaxID=6210 RepID=W6UV51_ECHGR|nr:Ubiquinone biosynthesis methyltransferase COQ5 [Echinococcus granulosus]EUB64511.1 Ubiquinone biosynthesis methyltransferase COQ5 [Echinococcus granulosus]KAH9286996.1 2-methoxy-6-polyprenyl-1,4-benzoquinol methylase, mitochondrial [Echinococcus granulosus]
MNSLKRAVGLTTRSPLYVIRLFASTHFGYQTVDETEKQAKVDQVFTGVAQKYDIMNDAMSAGIHRIWKNFFVYRMMPTANLSFLDVCGGTGDIAIRIAKFSKNVENPSGPTTPKITVCDINRQMMEVGKEKASQAGMTGINWIQGNAENLPFEDNRFDVYTIAFGIRNCTHVDRVLDEAYRVLKPGGRFFCLEFSRVNNFILRTIYDAYSMQLIPVIGKVVANDWHSYRYLVESIRRFPHQYEYAGMIEDAGFRSVQFTNYTFGVAAVHMGVK